MKEETAQRIAAALEQIARILAAPPIAPRKTTIQRIEEGLPPVPKLVIPRSEFPVHEWAKKHGIDYRTILKHWKKLGSRAPVGTVGKNSLLHADDMNRIKREYERVKQAKHKNLKSKKKRKKSARNP